MSYAGRILIFPTNVSGVGEMNKDVFIEMITVVGGDIEVVLHNCNDEDIKSWCLVFGDIESKFYIEHGFVITQPFCSECFEDNEDIIYLEVEGIKYPLEPRITIDALYERHQYLNRMRLLDGLDDE